MIDQFVRLSKEAGMRSDWVQAAGGNTSVKLSETQMLIKASGYQLCDVNEGHGYATINYKHIQDFFHTYTEQTVTKDAEAALLKEAFISGERPSIETYLHSLTDRVTLHSHPMLVNVIVSRNDYEEVLKQLFPEALIVSYAAPGMELAMKFYEAYREKPSEIIFMQNHGLIVSGDSVSGVLQKTEQVVGILADYLKQDCAPFSMITKIDELLHRTVPSYSGVVYLSENQSVWQAIKANENNMWEYRFCPDALVYMGKSVLQSTSGINESMLEHHLQKFGMPGVLLIDGHLYIVADTLKKAREAETVISFTAQVALLNQTADRHLLSEEEQNFLLNWDAEKFRKNKS